MKSSIRRFSQATSALRPPPDFLIVGTKRGGTTSLWNWLLAHPSILPIVPGVQTLKSSHYFYRHFDRPLSWYRGFFPTEATRRANQWRHGAAPVAGEASPYYLFDPRVPQRVRAAVPDVRIIMLLRDPVDRAHSHHAERIREGVEDLGFADALAAEEERLTGELDKMMADPVYYSTAHDWFSYRSRGVYLPQLRAWRAAFERPEQILVVRSEDLYQRPQETYLEVTRFLGVPDHPLREAKPWLKFDRAPMDPGLRRELEEYYAPHNAALYDTLGRDMEWSRP